MIPQEWKIDYYTTDWGKIPYREWFESLSDFNAQAVIDARLARLRLGNFGKCDPVGEGVLELKIYYGSGYRIYFGKADVELILLLSGGVKSRQQSDIETAKSYWRNYKERQRR